MTLVRVFFGKPSPIEDDPAPNDGKVRCTPTMGRTVEGSPDMIVLPVGFTVPTVGGRVDLPLAPSGPGWVWEICVYDFGVQTAYVYVIVPEAEPDPDKPGEFLPVDFTELVRVDRNSLAPDATPDPLWWAELEAAKATAADVEAARVAAAGSAVEAGAARDGAVLAAGEASGFASAAAGSALTASEQGALAATSADLASTAAVGAGTARTGAELARDATVAAAGGSEASAALAAGAAVESAKSATAAQEASGVIIEMTETGRLSESALSDTIGELSGPVIDAKVAPVLDAANGAAQSAAGSEAAALDVVTRANAGGFKGEQGADGNATMRVDTSAGTAIYISDGTIERLLSYDSGWRNVSSYLAPGLALSTHSGRARVKRVGDRVYFDIKVDVQQPAITNIFTGFPVGFQPLPLYPMDNQIFTATVRGAGVSAMKGGTHAGVFYEGVNPLRTGSSTPWPDPGTVAWTSSFQTPPTLPTANIGTPA